MSHDAHPVHLHGQSFRVLAAGGTRVREPLVKDTVDVEPHMRSVLMLVLFAFDSPLPEGEPAPFWFTSALRREEVDSGLAAAGSGYRSRICSWLTVMGLPHHA